MVLLPCSRQVFRGATQFSSDLSKWNTSQVTDMQGMFNGASQFTSDLSQWDTSQITSMSWMFNEASQFSSDLSKWDTSQVTDMQGMFLGATTFSSDLSQWNVREGRDRHLPNVFGSLPGWRSHHLPARLAAEDVGLDVPVVRKLSPDGGECLRGFRRSDSPSATCALEGDTELERVLRTVPLAAGLGPARVVAGPLRGDPRHALPVRAAAGRGEGEEGG